MINSKDKYDGFTRILHWLMALLIFIMLIFGTLIGITLGSDFFNFSGYTLTSLIFYHKSIGMTILLLICIRLIWRLTGMHIPKYNPELAKANVRMAHIAHIILYALLFTEPLLGWFGSSFLQYPVPFWGIINLTIPLPFNQGISDLLFNIHCIVAWSLGILITLHILGVIHHSFKKQRILQRMI